MLKGDSLSPFVNRDHVKPQSFDSRVVAKVASPKPIGGKPHSCPLSRCYRGKRPHERTLSSRFDLDENCRGALPGNQIHFQVAEAQIAKEDLAA